MKNEEFQKQLSNGKVELNSLNDDVKNEMFKKLNSDLKDAKHRVEFLSKRIEHLNEEEINVDVETFADFLKQSGYDYEKTVEGYAVYELDGTLLLSFFDDLTISNRVGWTKPELLDFNFK